MFVVCENKYFGWSFSYCNLICAGKDLEKCKDKMLEDRANLIKLRSPCKILKDQIHLGDKDLTNDVIELEFENGEDFRITCVKVEEV